MSKSGLQAAMLHGDELPRFTSRDEATRVLCGRRDQALTELCAAATRSGAFSCDFSPESLRALERWYFDLVESNGFATVGLSRGAMEQGISFYLGQVLAQASGFQWVVEEFAFVPGTFEIGVRRGRVTIMLTRPSDLASRPGNKRRDSLSRQYRRLAA